MVDNGDDGRRGIDQALHKRVIEQITHVTEALDTAIASPTDNALDELHASVDNLMRALGRVLIEIDRQRGAPRAED